MEKKRSFFNLEETLRQAKEKFTKLDPLTVSKLADVEINEREKSIYVPFINEEYRVCYRDGRVSSKNGDDASLYFAIIILHYLATADGTPLTGRWVAYRHLPGGDIYNEPFQKRAVVPFLKAFGTDPTLFQKAAAAIGGKNLSGGGLSMVIPVLPRVPICFTLWQGDEEIPSSANILFDQAASSYLPTEDYAHLPAIVIGIMKGKL
jgi:hypothetical protein